MDGLSRCGWRVKLSIKFSIDGSTHSESSPNDGSGGANRSRQESGSLNRQHWPNNEPQTHYASYRLLNRSWGKYSCILYVVWMDVFQSTQPRTSFFLGPSTEPAGSDACCCHSLPSRNCCWIFEISTGRFHDSIQGWQKLLLQGEPLTFTSFFPAKALGSQRWRAIIKCWLRKRSTWRWLCPLLRQRAPPRSRQSTERGRKEGANGAEESDVRTSLLFILSKSYLRWTIGNISTSRVSDFST